MLLNPGSQEDKGEPGKGSRGREDKDQELKRQKCSVTDDTREGNL
jgi:hypothetical protein